MPLVSATSFSFQFGTSRCHHYNFLIEGDQRVQQQIACPAASGRTSFSIESLPFADVPGQSKLFVEYQSDPLSLIRYYPNAVRSHADIASRIPEVLKNHVADRNVLCDALEEMNQKFGATQATLDNIALLREKDTVAVVSGQQAGLFSGPLYTIYKAMSAIKAVEGLRSRGFKAVPVFWAATEDHDFEEVSKTSVLDSSGEIAELKNEPKRCHDDLPVGYIKLDESIRQTVEELMATLPQTEFSDEIQALLEDTWTPHAYYGDAFAKLVSMLLGKYGLIILCPLDARLKSLAAPIYVDAIRRSPEIVDVLRRRSDELVADGYAAQVFIGDDYFPLFWQARDGTRNALKKSSEGTFRTKDGSREFTLEELAEVAEREPTRFSPSVVLRSVVQDHLLPTACYFGGAAEIAYFAQSAEVYRVLGRPVTPILHRQSFTIVESRHAKTLRRYDMALPDLFDGVDSAMPRIVDEYLNTGTSTLFAQVEEKINTELNRLDQSLSQLDPTLADNLATRRRKIIYHLGALRGKYQREQFRRDSDVRRQVETLFTALLPNHHLQERSLNVLYFLDRYGLGFIDWIHRAVDLDDKGHRIVYL